jgi:hypothetical protein
MNIIVQFGIINPLKENWSNNNALCDQDKSNYIFSGSKIVSSWHIKNQWLIFFVKDLIIQKDFIGSVFLSKDNDKTAQTYQKMLIYIFHTLEHVSISLPEKFRQYLVMQLICNRKYRGAVFIRMNIRTFRMYKSTNHFAFTCSRERKRISFFITEFDLLLMLK